MLHSRQISGQHSSQTQSSEWPFSLTNHIHGFSIVPMATPSSFWNP
jgi:hypothetical protein